jgi:hypothetical protein
MDSASSTTPRGRDEHRGAPSGDGVGEVFRKRRSLGRGWVVVQCLDQNARTENRIVEPAAAAPRAESVVRWTHCQQTEVEGRDSGGTNAPEGLLPSPHRPRPRQRAPSRARGPASSPQRTIPGSASRACSPPTMAASRNRDARTREGCSSRRRGRRRKRRGRCGPSSGGSVVGEASPSPVSTARKRARHTDPPGIR